jgi:hypothetical protein
MDFYTNCYIPSSKKEFKVNKLEFGDYLQLNSYISASDYVAINHTFDVISKKSLGTLENITNLDKFFVLIHLKNEFLSPILRLSGKNEEEKSATYEVVLKEILQNCKKYNDENFNLPKQLYYKDSTEILSEISKSVEEIKEHILKNKILLFDVPEVIKGIPRVYLNCFDNTLFYFCKLLYSANLKDLYRKMIILKKQFNFSLSEIYSLSPKELDIFLNTK